jgi:hypothetical protein
MVSKMLKMKKRMMPHHCLLWLCTSQRTGTRVNNKHVRGSGRGEGAGEKRHMVDKHIQWGMHITNPLHLSNSREHAPQIGGRSCTSAR